MHSISGLCVLAVLTTLAQSRADLDWSSNEVEGSTADPLLFSPDNLSSLQSLTDDNVVGDNFALTDSPTDDYTASLFADSLGECSFGGSSQPSRKLRARDNPSCSTKSSTNSPPVQLPDLGDIENIADPATRPSVPGKVRSNALDYYNVCPAGSKSFPDWVICGIKSFSNGLATWQNDVIDADICKC